MASLNRCEFIGNLGADPEVRSMQNGKQVVNLRLACSETWKDQSGQRQERTEWVPVTIFNENIGKVAERFLRKGSKVYVAGKWQTRKWTDQAGNDRYSTECVIQNYGGELVLLDSKGDREQPSGGDDMTRAYSREELQRAAAGDFDDDGDVPF